MGGERCFSLLGKLHSTTDSLDVSIVEVSIAEELSESAFYNNNNSKVTLEACLYMWIFLASYNRISPFEPASSARHSSYTKVVFDVAYFQSQSGLKSLLGMNAT